MTYGASANDPADADVSLTLRMKRNQAAAPLLLRRPRLRGLLLESPDSGDWAPFTPGWS
jgi:hypothetical protein